jgi:hypothetical protein
MISLEPAASWLPSLCNVGSRIKLERVPAISVNTEIKVSEDTSRKERKKDYICKPTSGYKGDLL